MQSQNIKVNRFLKIGKMNFEEGIFFGNFINRPWSKNMFGMVLGNLRLVLWKDIFLESILKNKNALLWN